MVRTSPEDERLQAALIENMVREDLNPVEEARACAVLVDDLGISKEELARRVGRSRAAISNLIRLLDLPDEALDLLERGELSEGHGRAILQVSEQDKRTPARQAGRGRGLVGPRHRAARRRRARAGRRRRPAAGSRRGARGDGGGRGRCSTRRSATTSGSAAPATASRPSSSFDDLAELDRSRRAKQLMRASGQRAAADARDR